MDAATVLFACLTAFGFALGLSGDTTADGLAWANGILWGIWIVLVAYLFFFRRSGDEFFQSCWNTAASATVKALILLPLIGIFGVAFAEGFIDGLTGADRGGPRLLAEFTAEQMLRTVWVCLFAVFFAAFQINRFRGPR